MSVLPQPPRRLERVPMAFDDYLALPESTRAEYVDGRAIVGPAPVGPHQTAARRVANLVEAGTDLKVFEAVGVWTGERRSRIPDVVATTVPVTGSWVEETPYLVVEVLSPSTRAEDTLRKSVEYLAAGIAQFWIVDLEHTSVTVLVSADGEWDLGLTLDEERPVGTVTVGLHGTITVDVLDLVRP